jgi:sulfonate transport system permease protein
MDGQNSGRADVIVLSIILLAIVGKTCDFGLALVQNRLLRWADTAS